MTPLPRDAVYLRIHVKPRRRCSTTAATTRPNRRYDWRLHTLDADDISRSAAHDDDTHSTSASAARHEHINSARLHICITLTLTQHTQHTTLIISLTFSLEPASAASAVGENVTSGPLTRTQEAIQVIATHVDGSDSRRLRRPISIITHTQLRNRKTRHQY